MGNCIVVVQFDLPKRSEEQAIKGGTASAPAYRDLGGKGLIRKDYLNGETGTGGVYLWENRATAEAVRVLERLGHRRQVREVEPDELADQFRLRIVIHRVNRVCADGCACGNGDRRFEVALRVDNGRAQWGAVTTCAH